MTTNSSLGNACKYCSLNIFPNQFKILQLRFCNWIYWFPNPAFSISFFIPSLLPFFIPSVTFLFHFHYKDLFFLLHMFTLHACMYKKAHMVLLCSIYLLWIQCPSNTLFVYISLSFLFYIINFPFSVKYIIEQTPFINCFHSRKISSLLFKLQNVSFLLINKMFQMPVKSCFTIQNYKNVADNPWFTIDALICVLYLFLFVKWALIMHNVYIPYVLDVPNNFEICNVDSSFFTRLFLPIL